MNAPATAPGGRRPLVAGNWKMNLERAAAVRLASGIAGRPRPAGADLLVLPPAVHLAAVGAVLRGSGVDLGAQDVSDLPAGPCTGELSAGMLRDYGAAWVVVGHSERRQRCREDDALIGRKAAAAATAGLVPIVCVGETLAEREAGDTPRVIARQLDAALDALGAAGALGRFAVAYEPVWAIGTGRTATPETAQAVHADIRARAAAVDADAAARLRIVYGGSVTADNAAGLFAMADVDGALVGGASLVPDSFLAIHAAAAAAGS